jgi:HPt (histidine-containing phosphotransfer) domain-containing protein
MSEKTWTGAVSPAWCEASPLLRMAREARHAPPATDDGGEECSPALLRAAQALPQLNLAIGLRAAAYDEREYLRTLRACLQAYAQRADALEEAFKQRDGARMRLEVHALHGSLACLGAETLAAHAGELELAIFDNRAAQVRIQTPPLLDELRRFVEQLRACFSAQAEANADPPALEGYPPMWRDTAIALHRRVAAYDYAGALLLLEALEWAHAPQDGPWLTALRRALEAFDYTALQQLLRELPQEA